MTRDFPAGNYRFIPAVFQFSSGAAADSGFEIERVRFDRLLPLAEQCLLLGVPVMALFPVIDASLTARVILQAHSVIGQAEMAGCPVE